MIAKMQATVGGGGGHDGRSKKIGITIILAFKQIIVSVISIKVHVET